MTCHRLIRILTLLVLAGGALTLRAQHGERGEEPRPNRQREGEPPQGRTRERPPQGPMRAEPRPTREAERPRPGPPAPQWQARPEPRERADRAPGRAQEAPAIRPTPPSRDPVRTPLREARPSRNVEAARAWQVRETWHRGAWPAHATWREHRARRWESDHRTWTQRGGYGGYRIPEAQFARSFGDRHAFRIGSRPMIYQGYPRFGCGGYWFLIVDPWPEFWVDDWYQWDDVYIVYDFDGYYLLDRRHPGIRLALMVSL